MFLFWYGLMIQSIRKLSLGLSPLRLRKVQSESVEIVVSWTMGPRLLNQTYFDLLCKTVWSNSFNLFFSVGAHCSQLWTLSLYSLVFLRFHLICFQVSFFCFILIFWTISYWFQPKKMIQNNQNMNQTNNFWICLLYSYILIIPYCFQLKKMIQNNQKMNQNYNFCIFFALLFLFFEPFPIDSKLNMIQQNQKMNQTIFFCFFALLHFLNHFLLIPI